MKACSAVRATADRNLRSDRFGVDKRTAATLASGRQCGTGLPLQTAFTRHHHIVTSAVAPNLRRPPTGSRPVATRVRVALVASWRLLLVGVLLMSSRVTAGVDVCASSGLTTGAGSAPASGFDGAAQAAASAAECAKVIGTAAAASVPASTSLVATIDGEGDAARDRTGTERCAADGDCDCPCRESCPCLARHLSVIPGAAPPIAALVLVETTARRHALPLHAPRRQPRAPALRPPIG